MEKKYSICYFENGERGKEICSSGILSQAKLICDLTEIPAHVFQQIKGVGFAPRWSTIYSNKSAKIEVDISLAIKIIREQTQSGPWIIQNKNELSVVGLTFKEAEVILMHIFELQNSVNGSYKNEALSIKFN